MRGRQSRVRAQRRRAIPPSPRRLAEEAIRLAGVLARLIPAEAEPAGLLALMTLYHARRAARAGPDGGRVLLEDQDRSLWDREAITRGIDGVERALRIGRPPGRFALQSVIAAVHAEAPTAAATDVVPVQPRHTLLQLLVDLGCILRIASSF